MIASGFAFSTMGIIAKFAISRYPATELMFFRGLGSVVLMVFWMAASGHLMAARTERPLLQIVCGALWALASTSFLASLRYIELATSVALSFTMPLLTIALASIFLKERAGPGRWLAVLLGFVGVILIAPPGADWLDPGVVLALGNPVLYTISVILMRRYGRSESGVTTTFYSLLASMGVTVFAAPFGWALPHVRDVPVLTGIGICAFIGVVLIVESLRRAPPRAVMPFFYVQAVLIFGAGYLLFGEVLTPSAIAGTILIVLSGLLSLFIERRVEASG